jgi:protein-disulfide isomerase
MLECRRPSSAWVVGVVVSLAGLACRSPAESPKEPPPAVEESPAAAAPAAVQLPGVDTSALTPRELGKWREYVTELLAPCSDQPVSIAQCVTESRSCAGCVPAAKFLVERVRRGDTRTQAEEAFRARFSPDTIKSIDLAGSPAKGAKNPVVTIVEWADFECPHCAATAPLLRQLVEKYSDQVQLVFKHYPLSGHEHSDEAARAAVAAQQQGKFWPLQQSLFESQRTGLDDTKLLELARGAGLDMKTFETDRASEMTADVVARDRKQADELGLTGTPMIYINGRYFALEHFDVRQDLDPWVELEIAMLTGNSPHAQVKPAAAAQPERTAQPETRPRPEAKKN